MTKFTFFIGFVILFMSMNSCKKLCMSCNCNFNTDEQFKEEDCVNGLQDEGVALAEYEAEIRAEKGYYYCDCYGVKK